MARHLNREHDEHERAQVAFQFESGAMHVGNVDAPRQRCPGNERQRSHAPSTGGGALLKCRELRVWAGEAEREATVRCYYGFRALREIVCRVPGRGGSGSAVGCGAELEQTRRFAH